MNDKVKVIRHRHGWNDGVVGQVSAVGYRSGGAAHYKVKDKDGMEYDIQATKDLKLHN